LICCGQSYRSLLDQVIAHGDPDRAKALLATLIAELRINSRSEILPFYRIPSPVVCAQTGSVGDPGFEPGTSSLSEKRSNRLS
jgi:hypothetical protein